MKIVIDGVEVTIQEAIDKLVGAGYRGHGLEFTIPLRLKVVEHDKSDENYPFKLDIVDQDLYSSLDLEVSDSWISAEKLEELLTARIG